MPQYFTFQHYYGEYRDKVFSFLFFRLKQDRETAEDLTSDVFVKALKNFDSYDSQYAFSTWIYRIARNTLIDHVRKQKQHVSLDEAQEQSDNPQVEAEMMRQVDQKDQLALVQQQMDQLDERQRECILLKFMNQCSSREIAEVTGESEENVRQLISRGIKRLRGALVSMMILFLSLFQWI